MYEIACTLITSISSIVVAIVGAIIIHSNKMTENRAKARERESRLSMNMMYAACKLSKGTALAIKNNHCNGEMEAGLEAVDGAMLDYDTFTREITAASLASI